MSDRSSRRILIIALAVSLLVHAVLAGWIRLPIPSGTAPERLATKVTRLQIVVRPRVHSTPVPHVSPQPTHPVPAKHTALNPVHVVSPIGKQPVAVVAQTAPPPPPVVPPSAAPCRDPNAKAAVAVEPSPPDIPNDVRAAATNATTAVLVKLNADGSVVDAAVVQTSGNLGLDQIALAQARDATYAPALSACKAIAGEYTFKEKWLPW